MMRKELGLLTLALGLAGVAASALHAQPLRGPLAAGFTQLFISPCGEPYRGKPGDPYPAALWFKQADLNHDGVVDLTEFRADHAGFFEALDADDSGVLEGPELQFYETKVAPDVFAPETLSLRADPPALPGRDGARLYLAQQWLPGLTKPAEGTHPGEEKGYNPDAAGSAKGPLADLSAGRSAPQRRGLVAAAAYGLLAEAEPVRAADNNLDGKVSKVEFLAAADRRFKRLDKRGDGSLTLDELPPTAAQLVLARRGR